MDWSLLSGQVNYGLAGRANVILNDFRFRKYFMAIRIRTAISSNFTVFILVEILTSRHFNIKSDTKVYRIY
jgi:hypothetical protein